MRFFVTGATGFVGAQLARTLLERGHEVVAYHRPESDTSSLEGLACRRRTGDLFSVDELADGMMGCDGVFHVAGNTSWYRRDRAEVWHANVDSTRAVLEAMRRAGISRGVLTSSVSGVGVTGKADEPADEETPHNWPGQIPYPASKRAAEEIWFGDSRALETVSVNPATVMGPGDRRGKMLPLFRKIADGKFPRLDCGGISVVDVRDAADGHLQAFERGRPGERYILAGESVENGVLAARIAAATDAPPPRKKVAAFVLRGMRSVTSGAELIGFRPELPAGYLWCMTRHVYHSSAKARAELGFRPRPLEETIGDSVRWYRTQGLL